MTTFATPPVALPELPAPDLAPVAPADAPRCRGCQPSQRWGLIRDTECPRHGVLADGGWWRTPTRLREYTMAEGQHLAALDAASPR